MNQTKFLTVDGSGNVVLGSVNGSARVGVTQSEAWRLEGSQLYNANGGSVVIGSGVSRLPSGYGLYVADGILTERVKVAVKNSESWSDGVFGEGYRLASLGEVERYINVHQHLPGVPSVAEGVDVGQMQAKLLEKVEELTLYVIELQKQNRAIQKRNRQLETEQTKIKSQVRKLSIIKSRAIN